MKTLHTLLTMTAWIVCLTACNDDLEGGNATNKPSNSVYMKFSVDLPTTASSRSETNTGEDDDYVTSEDGTEVGKDRENNISEIIMVLAEAGTNAYITSTELIRTTPGNGEPNEDNEIENLYTVPIPLDEMEGNESKTVNVYLYCNPTQDIVNTFSTTVTDFTDKSYTVAESETDEKDAGIWTDNQFLMTNAVMHTLKLPDSWNDYRTYSNPVDLGNIKVERSAARFDYKKVYTDNKYPVVKENAQKDETDNPGVFIQLNDITLINMSKSFYYLRRVSDDGLNTDAKLCGVEYVNNYVVDTDATQKKTYSTGGWADKKSNFYYNLEDPDTWKWTSLASLSEEDNWGDKTGEEEGYYIWRYAVENTIPAPVANQQNGISTCVAFRAQIVAGENCDKTLKETLDEGTEDIYVFQNKLYGNWNAVKTAAEADLTSELGYAYQAVTDGGYSYEDAGFTVYKPTTDRKYITYYYYWNRHNDNNKSTEMGPMEFAVVRNNVYKLSVEAIYRFGSDDPKPEIPDEHPEEEPDNVFFKVNVKVLPWVVRVNEIVFD